MSAQTELAAARDDVLHTRARMAETRAEIDATISRRVQRVKARLDVVQLVRDHPWPALAAAAGVGALISATGADAKAASAAAAAARQAGAATATAARQAGATAASAAREAGAATVAAVQQAPETTRSASRGIRHYLDSMAGGLALKLIDSLREHPVDHPSPT
jgi:hypothetical protein